MQLKWPKYQKPKDENMGWTKHKSTFLHRIVLIWDHTAWFLIQEFRICINIFAKSRKLSFRNSNLVFLQNCVYWLLILSNSIGNYFDLVAWKIELNQYFKNVSCKNCLLSFSDQILMTFPHLLLFFKKYTAPNSIITK